MNMPDPIETIRAQAMKRVVDAGIFPLEQIQRENGPAPDVVPYVRLTIPQAAEFDAFSQEYMDKTIIVEFDILTKAFGLTQSAGMYATAIENAFGFIDRKGTLNRIEMPNWNGVTATVTKFARGSAQIEMEENLYYLPVMLYVRLTIQDGASYGGTDE